MVTRGKIVARLPPLRTQDFGQCDDRSLARSVPRSTSCGSNPPGVVAIGAGLPGMVDSIEGHVYQLSNVPGWEDVALTALLEEWTGLSRSD